MADTDQGHIFISYTGADEKWAVWVDYHLRERGYPTTTMKYDFGVGENFVYEMDAALKKGGMVGLFSEAYLKSEFCTAEWTAAFAKDPLGRDRRLVPLRIEDCEIDGVLAPRVRISLHKLDGEEAMKQALFEAIEGPPDRPDSPPPSPIETRAGPRSPILGPELWHVPHLRNRNFTGRGELLDRIRTSLASAPRAALTAVSGLGGIGKSQVALEYAHRFQFDYDLVWWVRAESPTSLDADYSALALELGIERSQDVREMVRAVLNALRKKDRWLVVLDNAVSADAVQDWIPQSDAGHILITSRNPDWSSIAEGINVEKLTREESIEFLLKRTQTSDRASAEALANLLGDLPLALEQAAGYVVARGMTIEAYAGLFPERKADLLERGGQNAGEDGVTVATTWNLSFEGVLEAEPAAADLLNLFAFFAPDDIDLEIVAAASEHLPSRLREAMEDPIARGDCVAGLRRYSLVAVEGETMSVHRLVQEVTPAAGC